MNNQLTLKFIVFLLCFTASISVVYFPITKYDLYDRATGGRGGDVAQYVRLYQGTSLDEIPKPYRYRILTPTLARFVPFLPDSITQFYDIDEDKIIKFKFGIVNLLALTLASFFIFLLCLTLKFSNQESILGSFLFLSSFFVVNYGGVPLVEALAYYFWVSSLVFILKNKKLYLFLSFSFGILNKETILLVLPTIFLLDDTMRSKLEKAILCLPGTLMYFIFRFLILPTDKGYNYGLEASLNQIISILIPSKKWIYIAIDGGLSFGILWFLSFAGWMMIRKESHHPLYRLSFIIPLILATPFIIGSNIGRIWFLAFPIIIPLSLVYLHHLFIDSPNKVVVSNIPDRNKTKL